MALGAQPGEESGDRGDVEVFEGKPFGRDVPLVAEVVDQQLERVPVGDDRVR